MSELGKIHQFVISDDKKIMTWVTKAKNVEVNTEYVQQGIIDHNNVFALLTFSDKTELLAVYNEHGEQLLELMPPSGFVFSYLTTDHQGKVSVICSTEEYESSGCDWFFDIDIEKKRLCKKGLSY
ncbi:hypothetical protein [uncultured Shewanella sp.]|uniref:hypothetical protein n=1 Tax=uncultured Shewanella sp. TaxID=173975 RepID=UPI002639DC1F|nr:hypothetical protein [uncultured Shewanella sp.]